jgi:Holliday junction resolvase
MNTPNLRYEAINLNFRNCLITVLEPINFINMGYFIYSMSKAKGDRRERQAQKILESAGYNVEKPNSTPYQQTKVDFFELFDIMAVRPNDPVLLIQVKSNAARGINDFHERCIEQGIPFENVEIEFWVCHDGEGWRFFDIDKDGKNKVYDERDSDKKVLHSQAEERDLELPHH